MKWPFRLEQESPPDSSMPFQEDLNQALEQDRYVYLTSTDGKTEIVDLLSPGILKRVESLLLALSMFPHYGPEHQKVIITQIETLVSGCMVLIDVHKVSELRLHAAFLCLAGILSGIRTGRTYGGAENEEELQR